LLTNVPIPRRRIVMMKKPTTRNTIKGINPNTKKKFYKKKKNLYSKEYNSSSDMSEDDEEILFMGMKNNDVDNNEKIMNMKEK
jgi:hypothetical protein